MIFAKTSGFVVLLWENAHFQEIKYRTNGKKRTKTDEKSSVFSRLDFGSILGGFGKGLGRVLRGVWKVLASLGPLFGVFF